MHKPESVLENETYKLLWHLEIQTDYLSRPNDQTQWSHQKKKEKEPAE